MFKNKLVKIGLIILAGVVVLYLLFFAIMKMRLSTKSLKNNLNAKEKVYFAMMMMTILGGIVVVVQHKIKKKKKINL